MSRFENLSAILLFFCDCLAIIFGYVNYIQLTNLRQILLKYKVPYGYLLFGATPGGAIIGKLFGSSPLLELPLDIQTINKSSTKLNKIKIIKICLDSI